MQIMGPLQNEHWYRRLKSPMLNNLKCYMYVVVFYVQESTICILRQ